MCGLLALVGGVSATGGSSLGALAFIGPCNCDPLTQGYWHRQCLGVPADVGGIEPGRNGRGPQAPTEPNFDPDLMNCAQDELASLGIVDSAMCAAMDANPPSDQCQKALKQLTALVLNVCSQRVSNSCGVDLSSEGGSSTIVGDALLEIADLINVGECKAAKDLGSIINDGSALLD